MERNERYSRHYKLSGFGEIAQDKLQRSSVLVVGAGGLGCPALQYLAATGVGKIGIIDHDRIELSNLQRQPLFATHEIGLYKAEVAANKLRLLNSEIQVREYVQHLSTENAIQLVEDYDMVLDCTDNFATRYVLSDLCRLFDKPLVFGAIYKYEGQIAVFNVEDARGETTTYRHLFPLPPNPLDAPDCNEVGVLGVLPGVIGTMQATEAIKLLTGVGQPLCNKLMTINLLDYTTMVLEIPTTLAEPLMDLPTTLHEFEQMDYDVFCGKKPSSDIQTVDQAQFMKLADDKDVLIIDVRNIEEQPRLSLPHIEIPLQELAKSLWLIDRKKLVVVCQSGTRSLTAAEFLREKLDETYHISHLKGGVRILENV